MAISPLPAPPSRSDPQNFAARGDAFMAALPSFAMEADALAEDVFEAQVDVAANTVIATAKAVTATEQAAAAADSASNSQDSAQASGGYATAALNSRNAAALSEVNAAASELAAQQFLETLVMPFVFMKASYDSPCFVKTAAGALSIKAGTVVVINAVSHTFAADTPITMPALIGGSDYSVWVNPDGSAQAVLDRYTAPATAPVLGSKKIGGFHYGLVAVGTTPVSGGFSTSGFTGTGGSMIWSQAAVDKLAGINEFSLWDLTWRCAGAQRGMALDPQTQTWWAIYFCSTNHIVNGISAYNTDVASGTVLPRIPLAYGGNGANNYGRLSFYEALEIAGSHGLRLPRYEEFASAAFGVTEGASLGGAAVTIPSTARQPGFTSRIGLEQATGHEWIIGGPLSSVGGTAYVTDPGRGQFYGTSGLPLFGGSRGEAANSGSRASAFNSPPWASDWSIAVRAAGDHLLLVGAAR